MSKKKEIPREKIISIYINSDLSLPEAALKLDCSVRPLRRNMVEQGIKAKSKVRFGVKKGAKFAILGDIDWLKKQIKTKSFRELANEIGTTPGNISDRVKRYGLRPTDWSISSYLKQRIKNKYPEGRYGNKSSNWKDGITTLYHSIRTCFKNTEWVKLCLKRDNYICQNCKIRGGDLEVHHKQQLAFIIKKNKITNIKEALKCNELWDINNGVTLCLACHKKTDSHSNKNF